jgi:hypothetical protein
MLKLLFLLILITTLSSNAQVAQEDTPQIDFMAETNPEVTTMLNAYEGLYLYLLNQDDLAIQLSVPTYNYRKFTTEYTNTYKQVLKRAININSSPFVIFRADTICHAYSSLTEWCHELNIHKIHQKIDPDNILTYLLNLHQNDTDNQKYLITAAEKGRFSNTFYHYNTLELAEHIQNYIKDTPEFLNDNDNEPEIDDALKEIVLQQFIAKGLSTKEELQLLEKQSNNILSLTIGMYMANSMPNYNSILFKTCQNIEIQDECITIAQILLKDKTVFNRNLANRMLKYQYQQLGFDDKILKLEKQQKTFYKKIGCYSAPDVMIATIINENIAKLHVQNIKDFGEAEALKLLAFQVYNIEKEHGFNPDFNPNECETVNTVSIIN